MDEGAEYEKSPVNDGTPWPWLIGFLSPFLALTLFMQGFATINVPEPNIGAAAVWYILAAAIGVTVIVVAVLRYSDHMQLIGIAGGIGALLAGSIFAAMVEDSYGFLGGLGPAIFLLYFFLPAFLIGFGITLLVMGLRTGKEGVARASLIWGFLGSGSVLVAAMYHLLTINRQARLAAEAHEASMVIWVAVAAVVGVAMLRRSKC